MPLSAGDRLGPYEILAPSGAGGMGEVYRSKDIKLEREVAIKVLPAALAQDPDGPWGSNTTSTGMATTFYATNCTTIELEIGEAARVLIDCYSKKIAKLLTGDFSALVDAPINASVIESMVYVIKVKKANLNTIDA